jgi:hypothetical protein
VNDREMLEMAAKAGGVVSVGSGINGIAQRKNGACLVGWWNPLTDDGDALRLAVKLGFLCDFFKTAAVSKTGEYEHLHKYWVSEPVDGDKMAAARLAITRAAAEIGRAMP